MSIIKKKSRGTFPGGPAVKTNLPVQGAQVQPLVGELGSYMSHGVAENKSSSSRLIIQRTN